jgi:hypothetical protein
MRATQLCSCATFINVRSCSQLMLRQASVPTAQLVLLAFSRGYRSRSKARLSIQWLQVTSPPATPGRKISCFHRVRCCAACMQRNAALYCDMCAAAMELYAPSAADATTCQYGFEVVHCCHSGT